MLDPTILRDFVSLLLGKFWANNWKTAENKGIRTMLFGRWRSSAEASSCAGFCPVLVAICKWSDEYEFWWRFRSNRFGTLLIPKRRMGAGGLPPAAGPGRAAPARSRSEGR